MGFAWDMGYPISSRAQNTILLTGSMDRLTRHFSFFAYAEACTSVEVSFLSLCSCRLSFPTSVSIRISTEVPYFCLCRR